MLAAQQSQAEKKAIEMKKRDEEKRERSRKSIVILNLKIEHCAYVRPRRVGERGGMGKVLGSAEGRWPIE